MGGEGRKGREGEGGEERREEEEASADRTTFQKPTTVLEGQTP